MCVQFCEVVTSNKDDICRELFAALYTRAFHKNTFNKINKS